MLKPARPLLLSIGILIAAMVAMAAPQAQAQASYLQLPANQPKYAAIVVDAKSGEVLYAKRADSPRYPASITKVMTLYLTFEALASGKLRLDDRIVISPHAAAQSPTKLGVSAGDSVSVNEAMQAMAIKSANDVAVATAERLGGTESRFAALMTLRAKELGMAGTRFVNASGLPDSRQITTARDIAILSRAVMRDYPQYYRLFSQQQFVFRGQVMGNHNHLLGQMDGVDGLKTGFTNASGFNLAVSAVRDGRRLITVVLGGSSRIARDNNAQALLVTGFSVLERRARGERITIAQNLFEAEPTGQVMRPSVEQGDDGDPEGMRIMLAAAAPPPRMAPVKIIEPDRAALRRNSKSELKKPDTKADKSSKRDTKSEGHWSVQVGSFKSKSDAKEQLALVKSRFGKHVSGADPAVSDKQGGSYRSRFSGMSEKSAKAACSALKAKKMTCQVVAPS